MNINVSELKSKVASVTREKSSAQRALDRSEISTNFLRYITPEVMIVSLLIAAAIILNFDQLKNNFQTSVALNGLIIGILFYSLGKAAFNNIILYNTAKYLKKIDAVTAQETITKEDVDTLKYELSRQGHLMDTSNMLESLDNIEKYGILNFTDSNARLIKSKLGFRSRLNRGGVGFMAGILVMLGLLGTFLGLLKTIDAVGLAMGSMANIGDADGMEAMSGFIGAIAEPLQGMGLAFSSSLFGLSGSLLIGVFNHLCGGAQNRFIEDVSRWIDNRIPKFDPSKIGKDQEGKAPVKKPSNDDIKELLAGVSYLSNKTNKQLVDLMPVLQQAAQSSIQSNQHLASMDNKQDTLTASMNTASDHLMNIHQNAQSMPQLTQQVITSIQKSGQDMQISAQDIAGKLPSIENHLGTIANDSAGVSKGLMINASIAKKILNARAHDAQMMGAQVEQLSSLLAKINETQMILAKETVSLRQDIADETETSRQDRAEMQSTLKMLEDNLRDVQNDVANAEFAAAPKKKKFSLFGRK